MMEEVQQKKKRIESKSDWLNEFLKKTSDCNVIFSFEVQ